MLQAFLRPAAAGVLLASLAAGQFTTEPGIAAATVADVGDRAYASLADGGYVSFDGLSFERYDEGGVLLQTYGTLPAPVFTSFVKVDAAEAFAYAGESSNGQLFVIDLVAGTVADLANLTFNYDLAFDSTPGLAYVSAALGGFGVGNDIVRLDLATGSWSVVAHVEGPSGPVAVGPDGDLYYVTAYEGSSWPPPLQDEDLIRWDDSDLDLPGTVLSEADASFLTQNLDGGSSLEVDPQSGNLYLAHVNFQGFANEVLRIDSADGEVLESLGSAFTFISNVELVDDGGPSVMSAYQPSGAQLRVKNVDFGGVIRDRITLEPQRALASYQGPGSGQSGPATISITGGPPNGFAQFMLASSADLTGEEVVFDSGWSVPTFLMVHPDNLLRRSLSLRLDASGARSITYNQSAGMWGGFAFQGVLLDSGFVPVGTSGYVVNQ